MKFLPGAVIAFAMGAMAMPLEPRENPDTDSPYASPKLVLNTAPIDILKPITGSGDGSQRPPPGGRRDLTLKKDLTLAWKSDHTFAQAVLKANWNEADDMKVINMEDFGDTVKNVDCTAPLIIDFKEAADFSHAVREWGWINEKTGNKIILFVNHPACGKDPTRLPYVVKSIQYDEKQLRADMKVEAAADFLSIIPDGELEIDTLIDPNEVLPPSYFETRPTSTSSARPGSTKPPTKRLEVNPSLSLNKDLSGNIFHIGQSSNFVSLDCTDCGTHGYLRAKAYVKISWFKIKTAYIQFTTDGVEVKVNLKLEAHSEYSTTDHKVIIPIQVYVGIPEMIDLHFGADLGFGWDINFQATGQVTWGITGKLVDSTYRNCLKGCSDTNQGWTMTWVKKQPVATGEIQATVDIFTYVNPSFGVNLFGLGYEGGVALLAPEFNGDVALLANTQGGICNNPATILGLDVELSYGYSAFAYAGQNFQDTDWKVNLFEPKSFVFYDQCFPIKNKP